MRVRSFVFCGIALLGAALPLSASAAIDSIAVLPNAGLLPAAVLAQRIVDWRTEHGRFASVEQLREVKGIGESTYADLAAEVAVP